MAWSSVKPAALALTGLAVGLACAVGAATLLRNLLFATPPWDVSTLPAVSAILGLRGARRQLTCRRGAPRPSTQSRRCGPRSDRGPAPAGRGHERAREAVGCATCRLAAASVPTSIAAAGVTSATADWRRWAWPSPRAGRMPRRSPPRRRAGCSQATASPRRWPVPPRCKRSVPRDPVERVADFLMPDAPDSAFERQRERAAQAAPIPVRGCNVFLKTGLRCTGPDADHARVLAYAAIAFERLERAGGSFIGLGSSDARRIPEGWPTARADEQFIALLESMAPIAARHHITVSVESAAPEEVNYLNRIAEVVAVVAAVESSEHPRPGGLLPHGGDGRFAGRHRGGRPVGGADRDRRARDAQRARCRR